MDFAWTDEQLAFRKEVIRFAREELNDDMIRRDEGEEFSREGWKKCAQFGIQGLPVPAELGGGGADALTIVCALEALGHGCRDNGLIFSINSHMWSSEIPICCFGNEEQKKRYLQRLISGEWVGARTMTGSDHTVRIHAEPRGNSYVLSGSETFITNATEANLVLVFASISPSTQMSAFIVEVGTPGFIISGKQRKMGLRTSSVADLCFADCVVPQENMLGGEGSGDAILATSVGWERICVLAGYLGTMQRLLENSVEYARERKQFGQAIGKFSAVADKIANMELRLETGRLLLYKAAWVKAQGGDRIREASIAKLYLSEACIQSCQDAIQIHGGYGYMTEYQIERELRDAISAETYSESSEVQRMNIASLHGL